MKANLFSFSHYSLGYFFCKILYINPISTPESTLQQKKRLKPSFKSINFNLISCIWVILAIFYNIGDG